MLSFFKIPFVILITGDKHDIKSFKSIKLSFLNKYAISILLISILSEFKLLNSVNVYPTSFVKLLIFSKIFLLIFSRIISSISSIDFGFIWLSKWIMILPFSRKSQKISSLIKSSLYGI